MLVLFTYSRMSVRSSNTWDLAVSYTHLDAWLKYVGAANTDLVFGVVSEEFGLLLALVCVTAVMALAAFALRAGDSARSSFYAIAACGAASKMCIRDRHQAVPVQHLTQGQPPIPIGMVIGGEGGPLSAPHHIAHAEQQNSRRQHRHQRRQQHGPQLYLFQDRSSFPNISSTGTPGIPSKNPSCRSGVFSLLGGGEISFSGGRRTSTAFR